LRHIQEFSIKHWFSDDLIGERIIGIVQQGYPCLPTAFRTLVCEALQNEQLPRMRMSRTRRAQCRRDPTKAKPITENVFLFFGQVNNSAAALLQ